MSLTDQAAKVLAEIDAALAICEKATAGPWETTDIDCVERPKKKGFNVGNFPDAAFIATSRTVCPKSLRMNKTAIEGMLEALAALDKADWDAYELRDALTTLITQWNENK